MNQGETDRYIVYVDYTSSGTAASVEESTSCPDSLLSVMKNNVLAVPTNDMEGKESI